MRGLELSVVLPARDEAASVAATILRVRALAEGRVDRLEILVVDDGSADDTAERAREVGARVVRHERGRGYGAALATGFARASHPWLFLTDADGQFPLDELPAALDYARRGQAVFGYRVRRADPVPRRLLGAGWSALVRRVLGVAVRDVNCAFKLVPRVAVSALRCSGAAVSAEIALRLAGSPFPVVELPVRHRPRMHGVQTGARPSVAAKAIVELAALAVGSGEARVADDAVAPGPLGFVQPLVGDPHDLLGEP